MSTPHLTPEQLKIFPDLQQLGETERRILSDRVAVRSASPGETLFRFQDNDPDEVFLLSGRLKLIAADGRERIVSADSEAGKKPIAHLRPRQYTAKAMERSSYFLLSSAVWHAILQHRAHGQSLSNYEVTELEDPRVRSKDAAVAADLLRRMESLWGSENVLLPVNPAMVDTLRRAAAEPNINADWLANMSYADPATAAYLMRAANSLVFADLDPCDTVYEAVVRLGPIVTKSVLQTLIAGAQPSTDEALIQWLRQSRFISAICFELARQCGSFPLEQAATAGLLSNIGVILCHRLQTEGSDTGTMNPVDINVANRLGAHALHCWGFPASYADCARHYQQWQRVDNGSLDLCDLVLVADVISRIGERKRSQAPVVVGALESPPIHALPAFKKMPLVLQRPEFVAKIVANAQQRLRTLSAESQLATH